MGCGCGIHAVVVDPVILQIGSAGIGPFSKAARLCRTSHIHKLSDRAYWSSREICNGHQTGLPTQAEQYTCPQRKQVVQHWPCIPSFLWMHRLFLVGASFVSPHRLRMQLFRTHTVKKIEVVAAERSDEEKHCSYDPSNWKSSERKTLCKQHPQSCSFILHTCLSVSGRIHCL